MPAADGTVRNLAGLIEWYSPRAPTILSRRPQVLTAPARSYLAYGYVKYLELA